MTDNYTKIVQDNLNQLYGNLPEDLAKNLPGALTFYSGTTFEDATVG